MIIVKLFHDSICFGPHFVKMAEREILAVLLISYCAYEVSKSAHTSKKETHENFK